MLGASAKLMILILCMCLIHDGRRSPDVRMDQTWGKNYTTKCVIPPISAIHKCVCHSECVQL